MLKAGTHRGSFKAFESAQQRNKHSSKRPSSSQPLHCPVYRFRCSYAAHGGDTIVKEEGQARARLVEYKEGSYTVRGEINTTASLKDVWSILVDYPGLASVFSNIKKSRVVSEDPSIVLHQDCKWEFLIFSGKFKTELSVKEEADHGCLTFNLIASSFMKHFVGQWQLQSLDHGGCKVEHRLTVAPSIKPPPFMTDYTQRIFVKQVSSILRDLEQELELRQSDDYEYADL